MNASATEPMDSGERSRRRLVRTCMSSGWCEGSRLLAGHMYVQPQYIRIRTCSTLEELERRPCGRKD